MAQGFFDYFVFPNDAVRGDWNFNRSRNSSISGAAGKKLQDKTWR
jgi:hypothetical protein